MITIMTRMVVVVVVSVCLAGQAPLYLADDCCPMSLWQHSALSAVSWRSHFNCVVPRTLNSYGDRTSAAPRLWNLLPVQLRNPDITCELFRRRMKGHLFRQAWTRRSVTSDMRHLRNTLTYLLILNVQAQQRNLMCQARGPVASYRLQASQSSIFCRPCNRDRHFCENTQWRQYTGRIDRQLCVMWYSTRLLTTSLTSYPFVRCEYYWWASVSRCLLFSMICVTANYLLIKMKKRIHFSLF